MDSRAARSGQIVAELIWTLALIVGFSLMLLRLYQSAEEAQRKPRWEIRKEYSRAKAS